ncbi:MAG TPA: hypothetical protein PLR64_00565 [Candidatus Dojkabacteria bacterium]|nr:hypothetical protein [Candidatus Dojkabacteria bacterium]
MKCECGNVVEDQDCIYVNDGEADIPLCPVCKSQNLTEYEDEEEDYLSDAETEALLAKYEM